MEMNIKE